MTEESATQEKEGELGGPRFNPPLYRQRYEFVVSACKRLKPARVGVHKSPSATCGQYVAENCGLASYDNSGCGYGMCGMQAAEATEEGGECEGAGRCGHAGLTAGGPPETSPASHL